MQWDKILHALLLAGGLGTDAELGRRGGGGVGVGSGSKGKSGERRSVIRLDCRFSDSADVASLSRDSLTS